MYAGDTVCYSSVDAENAGFCKSEVNVGLGSNLQVI